MHKTWLPLARAQHFSELECSTASVFSSVLTLSIFLSLIRNDVWKECPGKYLLLTWCPSSMSIFFFYYICYRNRKMLADSPALFPNSCRHSLSAEIIEKTAHFSLQTHLTLLNCTRTQDKFAVQESVSCDSNWCLKHRWTVFPQQGPLAMFLKEQNPTIINLHRDVHSIIRELLGTTRLSIRPYLLSVVVFIRV